MNSPTENKTAVALSADDARLSDWVGRRQWAWLPLPILLIAVIGLWLADLRTAIETPDLLYLRIGLNFVFSTLVALLIAFEFGRSFLVRGEVGLLLFGCGAVIWGASGVISLVVPLVTANAFDANIAVTVHNVCIWLASLSQMAGAAAVTRRDMRVLTPKFWLLGAYSLAIAVVGLTVLAALLGWTAVFFVHGEGGTAVRWFVLGSTIGMLFLTTMLLWPVTWRQPPSRFLHWYRLSLLLLMIGDLALMLESVFAGPLGWVGAAAQYLGGAYMFVAAFAALREVDDPLARLSQPQEDARHPYAIAIASVLVAAALRLIFLQSLGTEVPYLTFYPALMLAALYGGFRAGVLAAVISAASVDYFWLAPVGSFFIEHPSNWLGLAIFVANGVLVSWVADRLQKAEASLRRSEAAQRLELERLVAERTAELDKQVAERLRAEEALQQEKTEGEFRILAEAMPQIVWATRADGWNIFFNQQWVEYTGLTFEESYGHGWNKPFHPDDQQRAWDAWQEAVTQNKTYSLECRLRRADGQYRWWLVRGVPLTDKDGKIVKWFGTCTDIHELIWRKQVESDLRAAKAKADRSSLAKSKFLAAASHDLRQPVQSLTLLLSVIERQVTDKPKATDLVNMAKASMDSLNRMLTGILDISRLDAGVITPALASAEVGELVDRLACEYAPRAAAAGLELRHAPRSLRARTDVALLERILRNLIENALRYTAKGGILIGLRQCGERVRIDVIDTGIGIPVDQQTEIFEEFRQLNNPARDSSQGLGLGLAIVSRLAHLIGAEVQVASRLGRGTRFSLILPLDRSAPPVVRTAPTFEDARGLILIIEDNFGIRQAYEIMLKGWGYETLCAASGEEALDRAAQAKWRFDAIIADHRLGPGLTGNAAATEIARRAGRSYPTMLVTGDTAEERLTEVSSSGFALLHKPVDADDLRRTLASLLLGANGGASSEHMP